MTPESEPIRGYTLLMMEMVRRQPWRAKNKQKALHYGAPRIRSVWSAARFSSGKGLHLANRPTQLAVVEPISLEPCIAAPIRPRERIGQVSIAARHRPTIPHACRLPGSARNGKGRQSGDEVARGIRPIAIVSGVCGQPVGPHPQGSGGYFERLFAEILRNRRHHQKARSRRRQAPTRVRWPPLVFCGLPPA